MEEALSKDQMLYESYLMMKGLTARMDRHGAEHRDDMEKIWNKLDEIGKSHGELSDNHGNRLTRLESEKTIWWKIFPPLLGVLSGLLSSLWGRHQ